MKVLAPLVALLVASGGASAARAPFGIAAAVPKSTPATATATATATPTSTARDVLLDIPRGGASTKAELSMTAFQVLMGIHAIVSERAAVKVPSLLYNGIFDDLEPDSPAEFAMETVGTSLIGIIVMLLLSTKTSLSPAKIVAWGSASCFLLGVKWQLLGKFAKAGFVDALGPVYLASFLLLYPILAGIGDTDLLLKIFIAFPFLNGLVGWITGKNTAIEDQDKLTETDTSIQEWANSCLTMWGLLAYNIVMGKDVFEAMKYVMLLMMAQLTDMNYIRKTNKVVMGHVEPKAFFAIQALLTYGFWADSLGGGGGGDGAAV